MGMDDDDDDVTVVKVFGSFLFDALLFFPLAPFAAAFKRRWRRFLRFEDIA